MFKPKKFVDFLCEGQFKRASDEIVTAQRFDKELLNKILPELLNMLNTSGFQCHAASMGLIMIGQKVSQTEADAIIAYPNMFPSFVNKINSPIESVRCNVLATLALVLDKTSPSLAEKLIEERFLVSSLMHRLNITEDDLESRNIIISLRKLSAKVSPWAANMLLETDGVAAALICALKVEPKQDIGIREEGLATLRNLAWKVSPPVIDMLLSDEEALPTFFRLLDHPNVDTRLQASEVFAYIAFKMTEQQICRLVKERKAIVELTRLLCKEQEPHILQNEIEIVSKIALRTPVELKGMLAKTEGLAPILSHIANTQIPYISMSSRLALFYILSDVLPKAISVPSLPQAPNPI